MSVSLYDSRSLTSAINSIKTVNPFALNTIFKTKEQHGSDKIDIEILTGSEKLAQVVGANEPNPRNTNKLTKTIKTVTLPRTYESKIFTAQELMDFNAIGAIYDANQKKVAQAEKISNELADLKGRALRLREKMAMEALSTGKVTVTQDNIDLEVDFGFESNKQLITLSGANLWSATTSKPVANIRSWTRGIMQASGFNATQLILGTDAADAFLGNADIRAALDNNNFKAGVIDATQSAVPGAIYLGKFLGLDVWEYNQQYVNAAGSSVAMLAVDRAILVAGGGPFRLHYGPAYRIANQQPQAMLGEYYLEVDSHSSSTMLQWNCEQKSLPTIHDPGCVVSAKVV